MHFFIYLLNVKSFPSSSSPPSQPGLHLEENFTCVKRSALRSSTVAMDALHGFARCREQGRWEMASSECSVLLRTCRFDVSLHSFFFNLFSHPSPSQTYTQTNVLRPAPLAGSSRKSHLPTHPLCSVTSYQPSWLSDMASLDWAGRPCPIHNHRLRTPAPPRSLSSPSL